MKIYFAGEPSNSRERTLIDAAIGHRLLSYGYLEKIYNQLRKWGIQRT